MSEKYQIKCRESHRKKVVKKSNKKLREKNYNEKRVGYEMK